MVPGEELAVQRDHGGVDSHKGRQEAGAPDCTAHSVRSSPQGTAQRPLQIQYLGPPQQNLGYQYDIQQSKLLISLRLYLTQESVGSDGDGQ